MAEGPCPAYRVSAIVAAMTSTAPHDGIVDLLGVVAYLELMAFSQLAADAGMAPTQPERATVAKLAVAQFGHYETIVRRLESLGADPETAMAPFVAAIDEFHRRTRPRDWFEGLVKAYVGDGVAQDFYTEVARFVDPQTRDVVVEVMSNTVHAEVVIPTVREAISADPALGGRLALWGRRLVGEMLTEAGWTGWAPTWPSSAGCSPGSPTSTPAGWSGSVCPPEALGGSANPPTTSRPGSAHKNRGPRRVARAPVDPVLGSSSREFGRVEVRTTSRCP